MRCLARFPRNKTCEGHSTGQRVYRSSGRRLDRNQRRLGLLDRLDAPRPIASGERRGYEAVEKMLGLKLEQQTRAIPITVIDHVDLKLKQ